MATDENPSEPLQNTTIYLIISIIATLLITGGIYVYKDSAALWEDFYVKEIVKTINLAEKNQTITIVIDKPIEIALKNNLNDLQNIFTFNENNNEMCAQFTSTNKKACYSYFKDFKISEKEVLLGKPNNLLQFKLT